MYFLFTGRWVVSLAVVFSMSRSALPKELFGERCVTSKKRLRGKLVDWSITGEGRGGGVISLGRGSYKRKLTIFGDMYHEVSGSFHLQI